MISSSLAKEINAFCYRFHFHSSDFAVNATSWYLHNCEDLKYLYTYNLKATLTHLLPMRAERSSCIGFLWPLWFWLLKLFILHLTRQFFILNNPVLKDQLKHTQREGSEFRSFHWLHFTFQGTFWLQSSFISFDLHVYRS